ncbi:MAG: TonB-dependent receptor [Deltaproteobacteria bacterium]|nr:TonB-dependent receptor [Deltaproteobacteria bacterium]
MRNTPKRRPRGAAPAVAVGLALGLAPALVRAQPDQAEPIDIEIPTLVLDSGAGTSSGPTLDDQLDLANVVQSAAKGVTTVQEAPAIVTVVTGDEIQDRQHSTLEQILDTVPGWMRAGVIYNQFPTALVRGQVQAVQFLHDGTSLFEPVVNIATLSRTQPIETIKRVEMITGPGGVLWGSNSLLGILNVITKDADDVDGVETGVTLGDGPGDRRMARAYVMYGNPDIAHGKAKLFLHGSFETFDGPAYQISNQLFSAPLPQPNSPVLFGPLTTASPARSFIWSFDGKLTLGKLQIRAQVPFLDRHMPLGFPGDVLREHLGEDNAVDPSTGMPYCPPGTDFDPTDKCLDRGRKGRDHNTNYFDRYVVGEYRARLAKGKAGIAIKGYGIQFVRRFEPIQVLLPVPGLLEGGLGFNLDLTSYRVGGAIDGDVELPHNARLLYGAEAFTEWMPNDVTTSRQGQGVQATFLTPYYQQLDRLPLLCPRMIDKASGNDVPIPGCPLTAIFPTSRTVLGAYVDPQWRPNKKLILDAGARLQVAPAALGKQSYTPQLTASGTAVYNFIPGWHAKLNLAQGFRPPVFNNVASNGEAVQLDGREDLKVETSSAEQAEVNARIFKGDRRIRELSFRADASYTKIHNFIQIVGGRYNNVADRGMTSGEFLGKLYVQGGHRIELGYTWLRVDTADRGVQRALPENWFNLAAVFNLIDGKLTATTNLRVIGSLEDPNRMIEYRNTCYNEFDQVVSSANCSSLSTTSVTTTPSDLVLDRIPASADVTVGVDYTASRRFRIRATVYNAFNARNYQPDPFSDYEPRLEFQANPYEDFKAYVQATYQY